MGEGLKRVCKQCGGMTVSSEGKTVKYDENGKAKKPKPQEGFKEKDIIELLTALGFKAWRQNSGKIRIGRRWVVLGEEGTPDVMGFDLKTGLIIGIERKKDDVLSKKQIEWLDLIEGAHGIAIVARSNQDVIDGLKKHGYAITEES